MPSKFGGIPLDGQSRFGGVPVDTEQDTGFIQDLDNILMKIPGVPQLTELAAGANRSILETVDFFGSDTVNEILRLGGSDKRVPTARDTAGKAGIGPERGAFAQGISGDMAASAGEVIPAAIGGGAALRGAANSLPQIGKEAEGVIRGMVRQLGITPKSGTAGMVGQDVVLGAASGAGAEGGEQVGGTTGQIVGAITAPLAVMATKGGLSKLFSSKEGVSALSGSLGNMSDDGAAALLAEQMVREGVGPEQVAKMLDDLGPDGIPADAAQSFRVLLREAANKIPRIAGRANQSLNARQAGQSDRLATALDNVGGIPGLSLDDEIKRLDEMAKPVIDDLYSRARNSGYQIPDEIIGMFDKGKSRVLGNIFKKANEMLNVRKAAGEEVSDLELLDQLKRTLDDKINTAIRTGKNDQARNLLGVKKKLIADADELIPEYGQARQVFARKAQLESAAELGQQYFKLKPREITEFTDGFSDAELRMFKAGAKQAILDRIDNAQTTANSVRQLFGRNGDVRKLQVLFDGPEEFEQFSNALKREAEFTLTRSAVQGNSTTAQQISAGIDVEDTLSAIRAAMGDPTAKAGLLAKVFNGLAREQGTAANREALETAGDILLESGFDATRIAELLRRGNAQNIKRLLEQATVRPNPGVQALTSATEERLARGNR